MLVAARIAIEGIFYSAFAFVAAVSAFWPWWKTQLGWSIVAKSVALALAVTPGMLTIWFGTEVYQDFPWLQWVAIGGLLAIPPILAWRAFVIWQYQRKARGMI